MVTYIIFGGIVIFIIGLILYYTAKGRREGWMFLSGLGAGIALGAFIVLVLVQSLFNRFLP